MLAVHEVLMGIGASVEDQVPLEVTYRGTTDQKGFYIPISRPEYNIL